MSSWVDYSTYAHDIRLHFIDPGNLNQNAFNGRFRDECLNGHWFQTMAEFVESYGHQRPEPSSVRMFRDRLAPHEHEATNADGRTPAPRLPP